MGACTWHVSTSRCLASLHLHFYICISTFVFVFGKITMSAITTCSGSIIVTLCELFLKIGSVTIPLTVSAFSFTCQDTGTEMPFLYPLKKHIAYLLSKRHIVCRATMTSAGNFAVFLFNANLLDSIVLDSHT